MRLASFVVSVLVAAASIQAAQQATEEQSRIALLEQLEKSVVVIRSSSTGGFLDESVGSGVIASDDGLIITAAHVVVDARFLEVTLSTGATSTATVLYVDPALDVALLRMAASPPAGAVATLGESGAVRKGAAVYVVGNPQGLEFSVASGIVSGRHAPQHALGSTAPPDADWIQTDAAMNAGVSGGPMFNSRGEVIGIALSIVSKSGGFEGHGFGVGIDAVKKILNLDPCLYLGFSAIPLPPEVAAALNVPGEAGLLVQFVTPGSPASEAGLRPGELVFGEGRDRLVLGGDVITHVDGLPVTQWSRKAYDDAAAGERHELKFRVVRRGEVVEIAVATVHRPKW